MPKLDIIDNLIKQVSRLVEISLAEVCAMLDKLPSINTFTDVLNLDGSLCTISGDVKEIENVTVHVVTLIVAHTERKKFLVGDKFGERRPHIYFTNQHGCAVKLAKGCYVKHTNMESLVDAYETPDESRDRLYRKYLNFLNQNIGFMQTCDKMMAFRAEFRYAEFEHDLPITEYMSSAFFHNYIMETYEKEIAHIQRHGELKALRDANSGKGSQVEEYAFLSGDGEDGDENQSGIGFMFDEGDA